MKMVKRVTMFFFNVVFLSVFLGQQYMHAAAADDMRIVRLESSDHRIFPVARHTIENASVTVNNMLVDIPDNTDTIPLPVVNGETLQSILDCIDHPEDAQRIMLSLSGQALEDFITAIEYLDIQNMKNNLLIMLVSSDGQFFVAAKDIVVNASRTMKGAFEDTDASDNEPFHCSFSSGVILGHILHCLYYPADAQRTILALQGTDLMDFVLAVDYFDIPVLRAQLPM